eukprot:CAMPEP_0172078328 /NCGR_PEP_ID=MMETSP1043-20130122/17563_1 /TAXON_ID=464988 /ORGANISM="Hemiselmis andersenii, Strain CCMP441" /LENGTH=45 /DNA_ID= /DNA_START= /DNA_END= /DNA_ORIENTATION=
MSPYASQYLPPQPSDSAIVSNPIWVQLVGGCFFPPPPPSANQPAS